MEEIKRIKIIVNEAGYVQSVYIPKELVGKVDVDVIDAREKFKNMSDEANKESHKEVLEELQKSVDRGEYVLST